MKVVYDVLYYYFLVEKMKVVIKDKKIYWNVNGVNHLMSDKIDIHRFVIKYYNPELKK